MGQLMIDHLKTRLDQFPRHRFAHLPTPIERLPWTSQRHGIEVYVKRDDCTGLGLGGNKTRKLEFLLADAKKNGADIVLTAGGLQSNHARQTAVAAAKLGLRALLVLQSIPEQNDPAYQQSGNMLLNRLAGADIEFLAADDNMEEHLQDHAARLARRGHKPYVVPVGGSNALGSLGYADCACEILMQSEAMGIAFSHVVLATGSCGTQAGLIAGFEALNTEMSVLGIAVSPGEGQSFRRAHTQALALQTLSLVADKRRALRQPAVVLDGYHGGGYGRADAPTLQAVEQLAQKEGLYLDPVYSGKAMRGMLDLLQQGFFPAGSRLLFLHTGGVPAVFAYAPIMAP